MDIEILQQAECNKAEPYLFDQIDLNLAQPALHYCNTCLIRVQCIEWVKPQKSFFDGVCGGSVWKNGKQIAMLMSKAKLKVRAR
jgi:WhiB family redox-sensing transcriptional regulator